MTITVLAQSMSVKAGSDPLDLGPIELHKHGDYCRDGFDC